MNPAADRHGPGRFFDFAWPERPNERRGPAPMSVKDLVQIIALLGALAAQWAAVDRRLSVIEAKVGIIYEHTQFTK